MHQHLASPWNVINYPGYISITTDLQWWFPVDCPPPCLAGVTLTARRSTYDESTDFSHVGWKISGYGCMKRVGVKWLQKVMKFLYLSGSWTYGYLWHDSLPLYDLDPTKLWLFSIDWWIHLTSNLPNQNWDKISKNKYAVSDILLWDAYPPGSMIVANISFFMIVYNCGI